MNNNRKEIDPPIDDCPMVIDTAEVLDNEEDLEPQKVRSHGLTPKRTLTHDEKLARADAFRLGRENLIHTLQSIELTFCAPNNLQLHSGRPNCHRCSDKNQKIIQAFYDYFLSCDSTNWYAEFPQYKIKMQERFQSISSPSVKDLKDLYHISSSMLREYILNFRDDDDNDDAEFSSLTPDIANEMSMKDLVEKVYNSILPHYPNPDAKHLVLALQMAKNPAERAPLYSQYYCAPQENDTHQQKNFKAKYARMFENRSTHDEVVSAMRKEAQELHVSKISALHKELNELQLAQSAHLKNKARKAEKDQRMRDRELSPKSTFCSLKSCRIEIYLTEENIECAICEWLHSKGSNKGRSYYCSVKHAEEDFDEHEHQEHQCIAGHRCFYYPQTGPPGETAAAGVCLLCLQNSEGLFYFCSTDCYNHNLDWHMSRHHISGPRREDSSVLELFQLAPDMNICS
ncbi:hypothetical protein K3495_g1601 [Podosphaera aphanis]|nr:hypothetical protein K3495_g1601 [Podosphaera aphanis]